MTLEKLKKIAKLIRYWILLETTQAGSGHLTSSLSAVELMTGLMFGGIFRFDVKNPKHPNNDRLIFSKGHAAALLYALWAIAGVLDEKELETFRRFDSFLEGHPTPRFKYCEAATGSLGQGLSVGVGMALNAKFDQLPYRTYVLLGDSEMTEGSNWEAIQVAAHYKLDNLTAIIDVNRLGQTGETMYGHNLKAYQERISAFGWQTILVDDGHSLSQVLSAYMRALKVKGKPTAILAKTIKGKGVSFLENKIGWHGKVLDQEKFELAVRELGKIDKHIRAEIKPPKNLKPEKSISRKIKPVFYPPGTLLATRKAYGNALVRIYPGFPEMVVLDAEVSNSTFAQTFKQRYPQRFLEMFIAEQNMVGVALGLSLRGKIPFVSTFGAFFTRAHDQIRMSQYSNANIKFVGSHAGVSIGQDGPSQMGLDDIAMFRGILNSVVLYPADAIACEKLVEKAAKYPGMVYIRTTRKDTPIIYSLDEEFSIGGSKVLKKSRKDLVTVIAAGITLYQALSAYQELKKKGILIRVIDLYSIKPIDKKTLIQSARHTKAIVTVEDHYPAGGLGEAVKTTLSNVNIPVYSLAVQKIPRSGLPEELLDFEQISKDTIVRKIKEIIRK